MCGAEISNRYEPVTRVADVFLYTLELSGGRWYVGITTNPSARLKEHRMGVGAEWTRLYPPVRFSKKYPLKCLKSSDYNQIGARLQEDAQVKRVMLHEGMEMTRGGSYSSTHLSRAEVCVLRKELFHATNGCLRCGRQGHWARHCSASTDITGQRVVDAVGGWRVCRWSPRYHVLDDNLACEETTWSP